jgi:hypothetical protein
MVARDSWAAAGRPYSVGRLQAALTIAMTRGWRKGFLQGGQDGQVGQDGQGGQDGQDGQVVKCTVSGA